MPVKSHNHDFAIGDVVYRAGYPGQLISLSSSKATISWLGYEGVARQCKLNLLVAVHIGDQFPDGAPIGMDAAKELIRANQGEWGSAGGRTRSVRGMVRAVRQAPLEQQRANAVERAAHYRQLHRAIRSNVEAPSRRSNRRTQQQSEQAETQREPAAEPAAEPQPEEQPSAPSRRRSTRQNGETVAQTASEPVEEAVSSRRQGTRRSMAPAPEDAPSQPVTRTRNRAEARPTTQQSRTAHQPAQENTTSRVEIPTRSTRNSALVAPPPENHRRYFNSPERRGEIPATPQEEHRRRIFILSNQIAEVTRILGEVRYQLEQVEITFQRILE